MREIGNRKVSKEKIMVGRFSMVERLSLICLFSFIFFERIF